MTTPTDANGDATAGLLLRVEVDGRTVAAALPVPVVIGRDPGCDVVVEDPRVSRHHCRIDASADGWLITDTSSNGTYLGADRITALETRDRATFRLGDPDTGPAVTVTAAAAPAEETIHLGAFSEIHRTDRSVVTIGRDPANNVVLSDLGVSRFHAELRTAGDHRVLSDLGSFNGTFVNGRPIKQQAVGESDIVSIGNHVLKVAGSALVEYIDQDSVSLEAVGLSVAAPSGLNIVHDISFLLPASSLTAIVGPSGSGKTTLLKGLSGDRPASGGSVLYRGRDLFANLAALRPRFGFVPQDDLLYPNLTVGQSLHFTAALRFPPDTSREERTRRVGEVAAELGLTDRIDLRVGQLSGGQRKRVSVAFELLTRPTVVFLDEPTSGLDPGYERSLMLVLRRLADGGRTLLLVTHATESLALCDQVIFLARGGSIAYLGRPHQALDYFQADAYADVFRRLDQDTTDWAARYQAAAEMSHTAPIIEQREGPAESPTEHKLHRGRRTPIHQLPTLMHRELRLLGSDRRRLLMLLLQGPILGALFLYALKPGEFALPKSLDPRYSRMVLAALVLGITWIALAATLREIVGHRSIYRRERAVGLSPLAYVTAKMAVFGPVVIIEAGVFTFIATLFQDGPGSGAVIPSGTLELIIGVALIGLAAVGLGLFVSAAASSVDQAMALFPLLLVVQLLFSGLFPSITNDPVGRGVSYATSAQWGFTAIASTVDLNALEQYTNLVLQFQRKGADAPAASVAAGLFERWRTEGTAAFQGQLSPQERAAVPLVWAFVQASEATVRNRPLPELPQEVFGKLGDPAWAHEPGVWNRSIAALGGLSLLSYLGTWLVLRLRDRRAGP